MDQVELNLPDTFEAADAGALVAAYAPELQPRPPSFTWLWLGWVLATMLMGGLLFGAAISDNRLLLVLALLVSSAAAWITRRTVLVRRERAYERTIADRPYELHEKVAEQFRGEIAEHREHLLAPDTEWQQTRSALKRATAEAQASSDYWTERWLEDETSELARSHQQTALDLHAKLSAGAAELDKREQALLTFFSGCEAKLSILERSRSDHRESRRLADLSRDADDLVMDAALAIDAIGRQFTQQAVKVGQALGALGRLQLKDSAGEIETEGVERVAERILKAAQDEERALSKLLADMDG